MWRTRAAHSIGNHRKKWEKNETERARAIPLSNSNTESLREIIRLVRTDIPYVFYTVAGKKNPTCKPLYIFRLGLRYTDERRRIRRILPTHIVRRGGLHAF